MALVATNSNPAPALRALIDEAGCAKLSLGLGPWPTTFVASSTDIGLSPVAPMH